MQGYIRGRPDTEGIVMDSSFKNGQAVKVVAYARASTLLQDSSIAVQRRSIEDFCRARNYELVGFYSDEGVSGLKERRPGLDQLLRDLRTKRIADVLVIHAVDRLGRSLRNFVNLVHELHESYNVRLVSVREAAFDATTAQGQLFLSIMSLLSEYEVRLTKERIRLALATKKAMSAETGWRCGRPPLSIDQITRARELRASGLSIRKIARELGLGKSSVERIIRGRR